MLARPKERRTIITRRNESQRKIKPLIAALLPALTVLVLVVQVTGCYGRRELEDMSLVTIVGVDKGQYKDLLITTVVALPRKTFGGGMGGGGGGAEGQPTLILSAEGNTMIDALAQITTMTSRLTTTAHTQLVILGEEMAKYDAGVILDVFSRNLEFRHNTLVAVSKGKASDFIRAFRSPEEAEPSEYLVKLLLSSNREMGICPLVSAHEFLIAYDTLELEPWVPYLALASTAPVEKETSNQGNESSKESTGKHSPAEDTTIVAVLGAALFRNVGQQMRMVGLLDTKEAMAISILRGDFVRGYLDIALPGKPGRQATLALHHLSTSVKTRLDAGQVEVIFKIRLTASVEEATARELNVSPEYHQEVVRTAEQEVRTLLSKALAKLKASETDVADLGMTVLKHFRTLHEWEQYDWPSKFRNVTADYDVKMFIFTSGFTFSPPSPR